jgi:8-oxo-dGTP pyrophosphatase MutT (NUDIX family)
MGAESGRCSHAGGVVVRVNDGRREYLLVRARRSSAWVFPKGHIEAGETPEATAIREVAEEAGVRGQIVARAGATAFEFLGERVRVSWFLMLFAGRVRPSERRETCWSSHREARRLIEYANLRELLDRVERMQR